MSLPRFLSRFAPVVALALLGAALPVAALGQVRVVPMGSDKAGAKADGKVAQPNTERGIPAGKTLSRPDAAPADTTTTLRGASARPKVLGYDPKKDKFRRQDSVILPPPKANPGYYQGSTLNAFRYTGPLNQSGIYGAFEMQKREWHHDPDGYRRRLR